MAQYEDVAPIISGVGISQSAVENYFNNIPEPPTPAPEPTITSGKCLIVANCYFEGMSKHNGILGVARKAKLSTAQVKAILKEIKDLYALWKEQQESQEG